MVPTTKADACPHIEAGACDFYRLLWFHLQLLSYFMYGSSHWTAIILFFVALYPPHAPDWNEGVVL